MDRHPPAKRPPLLLSFFVTFLGVVALAIAVTWFLTANDPWGGLTIIACLFFAIPAGILTGDLVILILAIRNGKHT
jgi:hypothetical protein